MDKFRIFNAIRTNQVQSSIHKIRCKNEVLLICKNFLDTFVIVKIHVFNATALKPQFAETADTYSYKLLNNIRCDNTGVNAPKYATGYAWIELKTKFEALDSSEQTRLTNASANTGGNYLEQAAARYDFVARKYSLSNFMNRNSANPVSAFNDYEKEVDDSALTIVIVISCVSILTAFGYAYLKKKR